MDITNTHKREIGLPNGQMLPPNTPTPVHDWDELKKNAVVAAWLKAGVLREGERGNAAFEHTSKDVLIAKLAGHGIKRGRNYSVTSLQVLLDEVEAKAARDAAEAAGDEPPQVEPAGAQTEALPGPRTYIEG